MFLFTIMVYFLLKEGEIGVVKTYDCIVIGGGTGGLRLALASARLGKHTLLIEAGKLGGTCLNNGCIPTKAMLEAAHRYHELKSLKEFGVRVIKPTVNIQTLLKRVNGIVHEGQVHIKEGLTHSKLEVVKGKGFFTGKKTLQVGNQTYKGKKIVIATGASNNKPHIKGIEKVKYLTNESILHMKALPKSIVMIGCGYISMEFATFFNYLGVKVTMLEFCDQVLGMLDDDVVSTLLHYYEEKGIKILTSVRVVEIKKQQNSYSLYYVGSHEPPTHPKKVNAQAIFVATGRSPNTKHLYAKLAGVKLGRKGEVLIDEFMETNVKGIYAIGDVTNKAMFAHAVKRETDIVLHNMFHQGKKKMGFKLMPWAVFTDPPVAGIGLNEKDAQAKKLNYAVLHARFDRVGRAKIIEDQRGFLKIIYDKMSHRIYGACCIGPSADIIIHEIVTLMNSSNPSIDVIMKSIHVHPTLSEIMTVLH